MQKAIEFTGCSMEKLDDEQLINEGRIDNPPKKEANKHYRLPFALVKNPRKSFTVAYWKNSNGMMLREV